MAVPNYLTKVQLPDSTTVVIRDDNIIIVSNPSLTAASGVFTWTITDAASVGITPGIVDVYDSSGNIVYPNILVNASNNVIITIKDTANQSTLAASTYKAVIRG